MTKNVLRIKPSCILDKKCIKSKNVPWYRKIAILVKYVQYTFLWLRISYGRLYKNPKLFRLPWFKVYQSYLSLNDNCFNHWWTMYDNFYQMNRLMHKTNISSKCSFDETKSSKCVTYKQRRRRSETSSIVRSNYKKREERQQKANIIQRRIFMRINAKQKTARTMNALLNEYIPVKRTLLVFKMQKIYFLIWKPPFLFD